MKEHPFLPEITPAPEGVHIRLPATILISHAQFLSTFSTLLQQNQTITLDWNQVERIDLDSLFLINHKINAARATQKQINDARPSMIQEMDKVLERYPITSPPEVPRKHVSLASSITHIGEKSFSLLREIHAFLVFFGQFFWECVNLQRGSFWRNTSYYMLTAGIHAIPIICITSLVIGMVLCAQGIMQLERFGAEMQSIHLVGYSMFREAAPLMTAIIVAGRSGSAYAAEIGTMQVNNEVSALSVMGIDPFRKLILPRIFALTIFMPILTMIADIMGLIGGSIVTYVELDLPMTQFWATIKEVISMPTFLIGILKTPLFGTAIGIISCLQGMKASKSAESVGYYTTLSVVKSIFVAILLNSIVSVSLSYFRIG